jgi:uncharacterized protein (DUF2235 family)
MPKNLVICCDGTANEFAHDNTNVVKLFYMLVQDPASQVAYYHPGLGTMEPAGALTTVARKITKLLGRAVGYGLLSDIRDAYVYVMNMYEEGDRVFLFGFSRGAYTVRAVASLLHMYGLMPVGNQALVPYGTRMLAAVNAAHSRRAPKGDGQSQASSEFALADRFKATFCTRECPVWFAGVWDTVSSVGWVENPLRLPFTASNPAIRIGRHAISIDERRAFFRTNLWRPAAPPAEGGPRDLKQVWFPGVHCDIGGGYPEAESGLSKLALEWMLREAQLAGLLVNEARVGEVLGRAGTGGYVPPDPTAGMHESLKRFWYLAEFIPKRHYDQKTREWRRRLNLCRRRSFPPEPLVHESAFLRDPEYRKRLPTDAVRVVTVAAPPRRP